ncbi:MAG TPA: hypothetical protein VFM82_01140 [Flavobacteriaceae bacterium]|nr:hypothetical protein [Flavobacteriaceae bacterium]
MKTYSFHFLILLLCIGSVSCKDASEKKKVDPFENSQNVENTEYSKSDFLEKITEGSAEIVPGKSIGKIRVGDKPENLYEKLGNPDKGQAGMCKSMSQWIYGKNSQKSLIVFTECDPDDEMRPHILWIRTSDRTFKTKNNLGVESSTKEIETNFPNMKIIGSYRDTLTNQKIVIKNAQAAGITFELEKQKDGTCRAVMVNEKGKPPHIAYFSFYPDLELEN